MDWIQVLTIIGSNIALFLWARTESRADHRALETWTKDMITVIQAEIKDFMEGFVQLKRERRNKCHSRS